MATIKCDQCDTVIEAVKRYEVRLPRPSDPSDLCAILWICEACASEMGAGVARTPQQWADYIESDEARAKGYLFLS